MTPGLVMIAYANGATFPKYVWVGVWIDAAMLLISIYVGLRS